MEMEVDGGTVTTMIIDSSPTVYYSQWRKSFTLAPKKTVTGKRKTGKIYVRSVCSEWTDFAVPGTELYKEYAGSEKEIFTWKLKNGT
jgi:hypothetical protein